jgi:hypothetical protein
VSVILEFPQGQHALVRTLWAIAFHQNNTIIYGRHGTLVLNDSGYPLVLHAPTRQPPDTHPVSWRGLDGCWAPNAIDELPPSQDIVGRFVAAIRNETPLDQGPDLSLHVMEIVTKAIASASTGEGYSLTTRFSPVTPLGQLLDTRSEPL